MWAGTWTRVAPRRDVEATRCHHQAYHAVHHAAGEVKGRRRACRDEPLVDAGATGPASRRPVAVPCAAETDRRPVCRAVRLPPTARRGNTTV